MHKSKMGTIWQGSSSAEKHLKLLVNQQHDAQTKKANLILGVIVT